MKTNKFKAILFILIIVSILAHCSGCVTMGRRAPTATVTFSNGVEISIRLYYDKATNTVKNFISLAESDFYKGLTVHRIAKRSLIQMGDPKGDGTGDAGYYIKGEFAKNDYKKNDLSLTEGMVAMARLGSVNDDCAYHDTSSSQFLSPQRINHKALTGRTPFSARLLAT